MSKSSLSTVVLLVFCTLASVQSKAGTIIYPGSICDQPFPHPYLELWKYDGSATSYYRGASKNEDYVICPIPRHNGLTSKGALNIEVSFYAAEYETWYDDSQSCMVKAYNRYGDIEIMRKLAPARKLGRSVIALGRLPAAMAKGKIIVQCGVGASGEDGDYVGSILVTEED